MNKMWAGRTAGALDRVADDFNSSIAVDKRMYRQDIEGSMAHAAMLGAKGIIAAADSALIIDTLGAILEDIDAGKLEISPDAEDIHMFVEAELTARIGDVGKRLHTARSRNDQVALDLRLYLRAACGEIDEKLRTLIAAVLEVAEAHKDTILPGYTHLQRAQPITFGHHLLAYAMMLIRDAGRIADAVRRMNVSPLGCCALAGTTYPIDREMTAAALGFDAIALNSLDGVSDRDFAVELESAFAILAMHLSRFAEEIILWSSFEFGFVTLSDAYTTGSSIMPQKKNSDMAELVRGKTGRVYGNLIATLTMLKGLPLAYNKDLQEDKYGVIDSAKTLEDCLQCAAGMIETMQIKPDNMMAQAKKGHLAATDVADYLAKKGLPFRHAHEVVGHLVLLCEQRGCNLDDLSLEDFKAASPLFEEDITSALDLESIVKARTTEGGTGNSVVRQQLDQAKTVLANDEASL